MVSILLVDDDPLQASLIVSVLGQRFGSVRRVYDAAEAFCVIEEPEVAGRLRLVISGHHLPSNGGPGFVAELRSRVPDVPILALGAVGESPADYAKERVFFLAKPFTAVKMLSLATQILADSPKAVA
jgi:CheY-like chemotaxis protein